MSKITTINQLEHDWQAFLKSFEGLPESAFLEPGVCGAWSLRDLLAHITTWEEEALKALPLILEGKPLPKYATLGGIDAFNAREQEKKKSLSLEQVRREFTDTHKRLMEFLQNAPEEAFTPGNRFFRRLKWDTYHHYRLHGEQIFNSNLKSQKSKP